MTDEIMANPSTLEDMDELIFSQCRDVSVYLEKNLAGLGEAQDKVRKFHEAFNHPVNDKVVMLSKERMEKRVNWLQEEVSELLEAKTPEDTADAIGDIIYLALGTAVEAGIQMNEVFDFICNANMRKLGADGKPIYKEDNKIAKPEGWYGPEKEIEEYLNNFNRTTI